MGTGPKRRNTSGKFSHLPALISETRANSTDQPIQSGALREAVPTGPICVGSAWVAERPSSCTDERKKKMAPKIGAKFEQGGFTSGRRKGPKTLFPSRAREPVFGSNNCQKLCAMTDRVLEIWTGRRVVTNGNSVWHVCKKRNPLKAARSTC
jgi:hypothetical protein